MDFGTRDGKRVQRSFKTKQDAKNAIDDEVENQRLAEIDTRNNKRVAIFDLTDKQGMDIIGALDKLPGTAILAEAAEFYAKHIAPEGGKRTVAQLCDDYVVEKRAANRRKATVKEILLPA